MGQANTSPIANSSTSSTDLLLYNMIKVLLSPKLKPLHFRCLDTLTIIGHKTALGMNYISYRPPYATNDKELFQYVYKKFGGVSSKLYLTLEDVCIKITTIRRKDKYIDLRE